MATSFFFKAVAPDGKVRTGSLSGDTDKGVAAELRRQGLTPVYVGFEPKKQSLDLKLPAFGARRRRTLKHRPLRERRQLDGHRSVAEPGVLLQLHLDLDAHDAVVVLLEPSELLLHVLPEPVRDLAPAALDDDVHPYLRDSFRRTHPGDPRLPERRGVRPADLVFDPTTAC